MSFAIPSFATPPRRHRHHHHHPHSLRGEDSKEEHDEQQPQNNNQEQEPGNTTSTTRTAQQQQPQPQHSFLFTTPTHSFDGDSKEEQEDNSNSNNTEEDDDDDYPAASSSIFNKMPHSCPPRINTMGSHYARLQDDDYSTTTPAYSFHALPLLYSTLLTGSMAILKHVLLTAYTTTTTAASLPSSSASWRIMALAIALIVGPQLKPSKQQQQQQQQRRSTSSIPLCLLAMLLFTCPPCCSCYLQPSHSVLTTLTAWQQLVLVYVLLLPQLLSMSVMMVTMDDDQDNNNNKTTIRQRLITVGRILGSVLYALGLLVYTCASERTMMTILYDDDNDAHLLLEQQQQQTPIYQQGLYAYAQQPQATAIVLMLVANVCLNIQTFALLAGASNNNNKPSSIASRHWKRIFFILIGVVAVLTTCIDTCLYQPSIRMHHYHHHDALQQQQQQQQPTLYGMDWVYTAYVDSMPIFLLLGRDGRKLSIWQRFDAQPYDHLASLTTTELYALQEGSEWYEQYATKGIRKLLAQQARMEAMMTTTKADNSRHYDDDEEYDDDISMAQFYHIEQHDTTTTATSNTDGAHVNESWQQEPKQRRVVRRQRNKAVVWQGESAVSVSSATAAEEEQVREKEKTMLTAPVIVVESVQSMQIQDEQLLEEMLAQKNETLAEAQDSDTSEARSDAVDTAGNNQVIADFLPCHVDMDMSNANHLLSEQALEQLAEIQRRTKALDEDTDVIDKIGAAVKTWIHGHLNVADRLPVRALAGTQARVQKPMEQTRELRWNHVLRLFHTTPSPPALRIGGLIDLSVTDVEHLFFSDQGDNQRTTGVQEWLLTRFQVEAPRFERLNDLWMVDVDDLYT